MHVVTSRWPCLWHAACSCHQSRWLNCHVVRHGAGDLRLCLSSVTACAGTSTAIPVCWWRGCLRQPIPSSPSCRGAGNGPQSQAPSLRVQASPQRNRQAQRGEHTAAGQGHAPLASCHPQAGRSGRCCTCTRQHSRRLHSAHRSMLVEVLGTGLQPACSWKPAAVP